jgi:predicted P-loop ATPase
VEALTGDRDPLWAAAAEREAGGASIRLTPDLWPEAAREQEQRRAVDPWEAILEPLLEGDGTTRVEFVTVDAVWQAFKLEANHLDNRHADRVAAIMDRHGFIANRRRIDNRPTRCWVREG